MTVLGLVCGSKSTCMKYDPGTSLVVQGLGIKLPLQGSSIPGGELDPHAPGCGQRKKIKHMAYVFDT